ncbi:hypothetical protein GIB67_018245, partial [Kingdonia uniflora]
VGTSQNVAALPEEEKRYQIEAPAIGVAPAIGTAPTIDPPIVSAPAVITPAIGSSSSATEIEAVVVRQVAPGEILEVANALMVDDDVEVGREKNFNVISSKYGSDLLEWKKGEEKDNDDKKDVEEKVKSEEEEVQEVYPILQMEESKNANVKVDGDEKVDDVAVEEDLEQPTVVVYYSGKKDVQPDSETMVVAEVAKSDIVFFNQEEVAGKAYQASVEQTTIVSIEEQTLEVEKTEDEASWTKESKKEVEQNKEEVFKGKNDDDGNSQNKLGPEQVIKQMAVDQTNLVLMESKVDITLKKRHTLNEEEVNERTDEKNQVDQFWPLRKDELSPEAKKGNKSTYMMIGEEIVYLNAFYTLYPNQWLDNKVIDVYIKALIQYFDTQHRTQPKKQKDCTSGYLCLPIYWQVFQCLYS